MAGISSGLYNAIFRRNQTFLGVVFVSAFGFEMFFDTTANKIWDYVNKGRQWKDIKYQYMEAGGSDDDE